MPISLGTTGTSKIYFGTTEVLKVFIGTTQVYASYYDLGTEYAERIVTGSGSSGFVTANAAFSFNSVGTVTATNGTSSPYTNWNIAGGTHLSWKTLSSSEIGSVSFTPPVVESTNLGENRVAITSNRTFTAIAVSGAAEPDFAELDKSIEVTIWSASSGGSVVAKGIYNFYVSAEFTFTGGGGGGGGGGVVPQE